MRLYITQPHIVYNILFIFKYPCKLRIDLYCYFSSTGVMMKAMKNTKQKQAINLYIHHIVYHWNRFSIIAPIRKWLTVIKFLGVGKGLLH